ncbi:Asp-tRNAAsn/Glu-tRNAGln amidotransferase A subunit-related amidase [Archaeoglobus sulfaticallidus PM70-1]|uniref:Asp-tRNAAsn/Glu-tRNAGln amidotransferase A subunit-related amidase n=1 Tax=Archaeoglobus sulfaticallidus PM70-1 TaxID=387631 RepID=N0BN06_9EURY|nr:amidase [Archaeoglobus sulfaticallidus]AGK61986.1 Asp-tRNAAsn/Glu-tRNAGln amidotransferase A subunit-related amidase [Archaeoglobus sulfaticallidus PM70-1]
MQLWWLSAVELLERIKSEELKPVEVVEAFLERIKELNQDINAFVTINENAVREAKELEKASKDDKPLYGLPVAVKDNVDTKGIRTTYGSKLYENYVPEGDAVIVERLKRAGAIVIGKTNIPELALLPITDNTLFGETKNPWDMSRTPGGSSGGSAAAVATGMIPVATGNDGGGSIRIPSAFCGLYGLKPSFGRVPCYPSLPIFVGLNSEGVLTRCVEDTALLMDIIAGRDDRDKYSLPDENVSYSNVIDEGIEGVRIAFSPNLGYATVDPEVEEIVRNAAFKLEKAGAEVEEVEVSVPRLESELVTKIVLEVATFMGDKFEEWKQIAYPLLLPFMELVGSLTYREYVGVEARKEELWKGLRQIFSNYDFLITPTTAVPPFQLGNVGVSEIAGEAVTPLGWMAFTYPFNFTGQPAASMPAGFTKDGLPVGMQVVGRRFDDAGVLRVSKAFQDVSPWQDKKPDVK